MRSIFLRTRRRTDFQKIRAIAGRLYASARMERLRSAHSASRSMLTKYSIGYPAYGRFCRQRMCTVHNTRQEKEMRQAFGEQAQKIISSPERFRKRGNALRVGIESEVAIFSEKIALAHLEGARNAILQEVPECTDIELGAAQIELRTPPVDILGTGGFAELQTVYEKSALSLLRAARKHGAKILRAGSNPFLPIKNTQRTDKLKYRLVPDYYNAHRPKHVDTHITPAQPHP